MRSYNPAYPGPEAVELDGWRMFEPSRTWRSVFERMLPRQERTYADLLDDSFGPAGWQFFIETPEGSGAIFVNLAGAQHYEHRFGQLLPESEAPDASF